MKDYKVVFTAIVLGLAILMIGVFTVSVFNYIAFLKEQNYSLLGIINYSITQLRKSIVSLEAQNVAGKLVDLKLENMTLREEAKRLEREVIELRSQQAVIQPAAPTAPSIGPADTGPAMEVVVKKEAASKDRAAGNRGYITKSE